MMRKGLVLEGGGMRGAYTAGVLAWMIENNVDFEYGVGISSGALHLASFFQQDIKSLHDYSITYVASKENVGIRPFLKEGRYVGYDYMFDNLLVKHTKYKVDKLKESDKKFEFGLYDVVKGDCKYFDKFYLDNKLTALKAACALPIASRIIKYHGNKYLDGGIKVMIPIERALENNLDKIVVITTKPAGYIRKPASRFMRAFMKANYLQYPQLCKDYNVRHENYNRQVQIINDLVKEDKALHLLPSRVIDVSRFSASVESLQELYELGFSDCEMRKEKIFSYLGMK